MIWFREFSTRCVVPTPSPRLANHCAVCVWQALSPVEGEEGSLIVTYHPTPFHKIKKITKKDNVGKMILRCAASNTAVYSPHTACDAAVGGVNDWLAQGMGEGKVACITPTNVANPEGSCCGAGEGRLLELSQATPLSELVANIKAHLHLEHVRVALAFNRFGEGAKAGDALDMSAMVSTVAMCAGSGSSVLGGVEADVWLTGELSHHEILAANAAGTTVILTDHTHTERGYLPIMAGKIKDILQAEGLAVPEMVISAVDADPLVIV